MDWLIDKVQAAVLGKGLDITGIAFRVSYAGSTALVEMSSAEVAKNAADGTLDALIEARVNGAFITARNNAMAAHNDPR